MWLTESNRLKHLVYAIPCSIIGQIIQALCIYGIITNNNFMLYLIVTISIIILFIYGIWYMIVK